MTIPVGGGIPGGGKVKDKKPTEEQIRQGNIDDAKERREGIARYNERLAEQRVKTSQDNKVETYPDKCDYINLGNEVLPQSYCPPDSKTNSEKSIFHAQNVAPEDMFEISNMKKKAADDRVKSAEIPQEWLDIYANPQILAEGLQNQIMQAGGPINYDATDGKQKKSISDVLQTIPGVKEDISRLDNILNTPSIQKINEAIKYNPDEKKSVAGFGKFILHTLDQLFTDLPNKALEIPIF